MSWLERWMRNAVLWPTVSFVALFWLVDYVAGTEATRNGMDYVVLFVSSVAIFRYGPSAWRAFRDRSRDPSAQLVIGNVIFWSGINAQSIWQLAYRAAQRPEWMQLHPLNGQLKGWIVWGGILCIRATIAEPVLPSSKLLPIIIALAAGIAIGIAGSRYLGLLP